MTGYAYVCLKSVGFTYASTIFDCIVGQFR
jgi:hypothetical protein